jgi:isopenicillin-N N-acyltransferase-like protein
MLKKTLRFLGWVLVGIVLLVVGLLIYVRIVAVNDPPVPASLEALKYEVVESDTGLYTIGNNWFRKSESGLYELYVEGEAF